MAYPSTFDSLPANHQDSVDEFILAEHVNRLERTVNAMQSELGLSPKGGSASVKARFDGIDTTIAGLGGGGGGGTGVALIPTSTAQNTIAPTTNITGLTVKGSSAQTADVGAWFGKVGDANARVRITPAGIVHQNMDDVEAFVSGGGTGTSVPFRVQSAGSTQPFFRIASFGTLQWGAGGSSTPDLLLERGGVGNLHVPLGSMTSHTEQTDAAQPGGGVMAGGDLFYQRTTPTPQNVAHRGINSSVNYGTSSINAQGVVHGATIQYTVEGSNAALNEHAAHVVYFKYVNGHNANPGRAWMTDWNMHSPVTDAGVAARPNLWQGVTMFSGMYHASGPVSGKSYAYAAITKPGGGGGKGAGHDLIASHPLDVGFWVIGTSGSQDGTSSITQGYRRGIQIGGEGIAQTAWGAKSRIGTGIHLTDYDTIGIHFQAPYSGTNPYAIVADVGAGIIVANDGLSVPSITGVPDDAAYPGGTIRNGLLEVNTAGQLWFRAAGSWHLVTST